MCLLLQDNLFFHVQNGETLFVHNAHNPVYNTTSKGPHWFYSISQWKHLKLILVIWLHTFVCFGVLRSHQPALKHILNAIGNWSISCEVENCYLSQAHSSFCAIIQDETYHWCSSDWFWSDSRKGTQNLCVMNSNFISRWATLHFENASFAVYVSIGGMQ